MNWISAWRSAAVRTSTMSTGQSCSTPAYSTRLPDLQGFGHFRRQADAPLFFGLQGFNALHAGQAARGKALILPGAEGLVGDLRIGQFAHDARGCPHYQLPGWHNHAGLHERHGTHDAGIPDYRAVHDDRIHAHHRVAPYRAAMQHGPVPHMAVFVNDGFEFVRAMNNAGILDVGTALHDDTAEITAQTCHRTHIHTRTDDDVSDQDSGGVNIGSGVDDRDDAIDGIHVQHDSSLLQRIFYQDKTVPRIATGP